MKIRKSLLRVSLAGLCWRILQWTSVPVKTKSQGLPDLSPTDDAENVDEYLDRLNELLINRSDSVREIAITAPYSGGKSSLINTFIRKNPFYKYTCISLTSFYSADQTSGHAAEGLNKIEKSIVQQILYKVDSSKAPNSRYRRIYPKPMSYRHSIFVAISISVWAAIVLLGLISPSFSISSIFLNAIKENSPINFYLWCLVYLFSLPILLIHDCYRAFQKARITKLNLVKGEISFDERENDSVFNIYLEEIIYYFHISKSDVVFFEDLDRFKRTDIFIKLKELNKLINDSSDVTQRVRFVYALRDNVFQGKNRTKFFDSIIPVIPVVNKTNSYPHIKKIIVAAGFEKDLDDSFLRDIAVYIDDMRLIKNIVAEYGMYRNTLIVNLGSISRTKLFSFIVYKNIYSDDFAKLHDDQGTLFGVFDRVKKIKLEREMRIASNINDLERELIDADGELTQSLLELNSYYLLTILKEISPNATVRTIENRNIYDVPKPEVFDQIAAVTSNVTFSIQQQGNRRASIPFSFFMEEMSPTYSVRRKRIEDKGKERQQSLNTSIQIARQQLASIKTLSLRELCVDGERDTIFTNTESEHLLIHMIEKGYIDEHYHLYITHFIEGNMTRGDMDFVMAVKSRNQTDADKPINNCSETLKYLSEEEFASMAFFNHDMFSYLLDIKSFSPLRSFIRQALKGHKGSLTIVDDSFDNFRNKDRWLDLLCDEWEGIFGDVVSSTELISADKSKLIVSMLAELDDHKKVHTQNIEALRGFIEESEHIPNFFPVDTNARERLFSAFNFLGVRFRNLSDGVNQSAFVEHALAFETFEVTGNNIAEILKSIGKTEYSNQLDFSELVLIENADFESFIENRISDIAKLIADKEICITKNIDLIGLINDEQIDLEVRQSLVQNIDFVVEDVNELTSNAEIFESLLEVNKLAPRWVNVLGLYRYDPIDDAEVSTFISKKESLDTLCNEDYEFSDSDIELLSNVIANDLFGIEAFKGYCDFLKPIYPTSKFREIGQSRLEYLIEQQLVPKGLGSYEELKAIDRSLSTYFLAINFSEFVDADSGLSDEIQLDEADFYELLSSEKLSLNYKRILIQARVDLINPNYKPETLANCLVPEDIVPYRADLEIPELNVDTLLSLIKSVDKNDLKKRLFTYQLIYLHRENIPIFLRLLGVDGMSIANSRGYTLITKTDVNKALAKALELSGYISSVTETKATMFTPARIRINHKK